MKREERRSRESTSEDTVSEPELNYGKRKTKAPD
jgi:hypothetical protein